MDFSLSMLAVSCWWLLLVANSATLGVPRRAIRKHQPTSRYNQENYPSMTPDSLRPRPRLMCAELCFAGLGGPPCGQRCSNMTDLPETFTEGVGNNISETMYTPIVGPRKQVCSTLCEYGLGQPLCGCKFQKKRQISWLLICNSYCKLENLQLYGCPICDVVPLLSPGVSQVASSNFATFSSETDPDWDKICNGLCQVADGGSACNCDLPPF